MIEEHLTVACEKCGSHELVPLGNSPSIISRILNPLIEEVVGEEYVDSGHEMKVGCQSIKYKCKVCNHKFFPKLIEAQEEHELEEPCEITLYRENGFVGALMPYYVYLNGKYINTLANGKSILFTTYRIQNTIVITANDGTAFPDMYQFKASNNMKIEAKFKRQFIRK